MGCSQVLLASGSYYYDATSVFQIALNFLYGFNGEI